VLELRSSEPPSLRVARDERGFSIVLLRTGLEDELASELASVDDPQLSIRGRQLGDDLVLRLTAERADELELRHRNVIDPGMSVFRTRLEISTIEDDGRIQRLSAAVEGMTASNLRPCVRAFERALLTELEKRDLTRTLGRDDHPEAPTLRAALRRLAAVSSEGVLHTRSGEILSVSSPLEFELAWSRSGQVDGYLAWLAALAARVEPRDGGVHAFRSLIAPAWTPARFSALNELADDAGRRCESAISSATVGGRSGSAPLTGATSESASSQP
jgi:hypothetical protein